MGSCRDVARISGRSWQPLRAVALAGTAHVAEFANGRPPASETIHVEKGNHQNIIAGLTFGMVVSHDGGTTWQWMCEAAVGYAGLSVADPIYQWTSTGAIFATTFDGLTVNRDGCSFVPTPLGATFATAFATGADGTLYVGMSDTTAATASHSIFKSTDDGVTWNAGVEPMTSLAGDWLQSIVTAPSDATRLYASGYREGSGTSGTRTFFMYESTDSGTTFTPLPITDFTPISKDSTITLSGVSPSNADVLFARVDYETQSLGTSYYRSADAGAHWTKVLCGSLPCAVGAAGIVDTVDGFTIDSHDNVYVGSLTAGEWTSTDGGVTFTHVATTKNIQCLATDSPAITSGACGRRLAFNGPNMMGVGETTDFSNWTTKLLFQNIQQPVSCAASTVQNTMCQAMTWCGLRFQLGITANPTDCPSLVDAPPVAVDAGTPGGKSKGCCDAGAGPSGLALAAIVGMLLWWPGARRRSRTSC